MCLEALKDLVLRLAIDDFGTGSNSLSCFRTCTMDVVKIDTFFIDRITLDVEGEAMVRGIIDLSRALGLTTIAGAWNATTNSPSCMTSDATVSRDICLPSRCRERSSPARWP